MPPLKLEVLPMPELKEAGDRFWFKIRLDSELRWQPDAWRWPVTDSQIEAVLNDPELSSPDEKVRRLCQVADRSRNECQRAIMSRKWGPDVNRYVGISIDDFERQKAEPKVSSSTLFWFYRGRLVKVIHKGPVDELSLRIKHKVLNHEKALDKLRREVEAFENFSRLQGASRVAISETVRMFVWQRDGGRCTQCGSQQRLEFDHVIPIAKGGSNTERNIQLLCEVCNRSKGSTIC